MPGGPWGLGWSLTSTGLSTGSPFNQQVRGVGTPSPGLGWLVLAP